MDAQLQTIVIMGLMRDFKVSPKAVKLESEQNKLLIWMGANKDMVSLLRPAQSEGA